MALNRDEAREKYAAENDQFLLNYSDYLQGYRVISRNNELRPLIIELVDSNQKPVSIPWPPVSTTTVSSKRILGIKLMVNPSTISLNMAKIINRTQTMVGWIEEHWGEEIDTITLAGNTKAFVIGDTSVRSVYSPMVNEAANKEAAIADYYSYLGLGDYSVQTQSVTRNLSNFGLTVSNRRDSVSYKEMKKIVQIFSTNGCIFDENGFVSDRKFIRITYDYSSYIGYFESIDITEDATTPYKFNYTITFKSEKTLYRFINRKNVVRS